MGVLIVFVLSLISAVCYRLGGTSAGTRWRDVGVSLCQIGAVIALFGFKWAELWALPLMFGLSWGALSTYRYFLPKPKDYLWYHFALHGLFIGLAAIPTIFIGIHWWAILGRAVLLSMLTSVWSVNIGKDWLEEGGRGFFITATTPLLLI